MCDYALESRHVFSKGSLLHRTIVYKDMNQNKGQFAPQSKCLREREPEQGKLSSVNPRFPFSHQESVERGMIKICLQSK